MNEELKFCPFCGSRDVETCGNSAGTRWARCNGCNAETKGFGSESDAIAAWNRRAAPADVPAPNYRALFEETLAELLICKSGPHAHKLPEAPEPAQQSAPSKVFTVSSSDYDGASVEKVFASRESANGYALAENAKLGKKFPNQASFDVDEFEVQP